MDRLKDKDHFKKNKNFLYNRSEKKKDTEERHNEEWQKW